MLRRVRHGKVRIRRMLRVPPGRCLQVMVAGGYRLSSVGYMGRLSVRRLRPLFVSIAGHPPGTKRVQGCQIFCLSPYAKAAREDIFVCSETIKCIIKTLNLWKGEIFFNYFRLQSTKICPKSIKLMTY